MSELQAPRRLGHLTRRAYAPQRLQSRIGRFARWAMVCGACLSLGAAGAFAYLQHAQACVPCTAPPSDDSVQLELTRTRLALEQETAARAAVQQSADASAAQARRLSEELRFLRGQAQPR